jgi:hypothetical protein
MSETPPPYEEILAYLRQHGRTYSRESLEQQLRRAGADFATIDRAFLAWEDEVLAVYSPPPRRPAAWPWSLALAAVSVLLPGILLKIGIGGLKGPTHDDGGLNRLAWQLVFGLWLAEVMIGILLAPFHRRLSRILQLAAFWQVCLAIAGVLLVFGFCVWLFAQMARGGHG